MDLQNQVGIFWMRNLTVREVSAMEELSNTFATGTSARNKCDSQFILFIHLPHTFRFYNSCQYLPILKRNCLQKRGGGGGGGKGA